MLISRDLSSRDEMNGKVNNMLSDSVVDTLWETLIALATAAGICVSVISLAGHLNEARAARSGEASITPSAPTPRVTGLSKIDQTKSRPLWMMGTFADPTKGRRNKGSNNLG
jgi:hypothetical protein